MTLRGNARLAGMLFLAYIAKGITQLVMTGSVTAGAAGTVETLTRLVAHQGIMRMSALLSLVEGFEAVALGAALYALTSRAAPAPVR